MRDRRNRMILATVGLLLFVGATLSVLLGAAAFGSKRADAKIFDNTVIRWWNQPGWISYAVVVAIGALAVIIGLRLLMPQFRRNDGKRRTPTITFPPEGRGETTLRAPALSHGLENDLESIPDVHSAMVGLFGEFPEVEIRAVIEVGDDADLEQLPAQVDEVLGRLTATTGITPNPVQVTVRFKSAERQRQLA